MIIDDIAEYNKLSEDVHAKDAEIRKKIRDIVKPILSKYKVHFKDNDINYHTNTSRVNINLNDRILLKTVEELQKALGASNCIIEGKSGNIVSLNFEL